jgi:spore germination cell wall hydrolase CwlJ-like protein
VFPALGLDYVVAVVVATEVPPESQGAFTAAMIPLALQAVCDVIRNRVAHPTFPDTAVQVVLQPKQFSAVCREDYWIRAMAGRWFPAHVEHALTVWQADAPRVAGEACWYYSPISMMPAGSQPSWIAGKREVLVPGLDAGYFRFYAEV